MKHFGKTRWITKLSLGFAALAVVFASVVSTPASRASDDATVSTLGGEIPIPFKDANLRVELASGELYVLRGKVRVFANVPFFEVDLDQHGWLASELRTRSPYYVLEGVLDDWKAYEGQNIQLYSRAVGKIFRRSQQLFYGIWLQSLAEPTRIGRIQHSVR